MFRFSRMRTSLQDYQTTPEVPFRTGTAESLRTNTEMYFPQMQNTSTANDQESTGSKDLHECILYFKGNSLTAKSIYIK